jgi:hypothetical protein
LRARETSTTVHIKNALEIRERDIEIQATQEYHLIILEMAKE